MSGVGPKGSRTRCRAPIRVGPFRFPPDLVRHWENGEWVPGPGRVMRVTDAPGPPGPGDVSRVRGPSRWLDATVPCAIAADPSLARFVDWDVLARSIPTRPKQFVGAKWDELWAAWYDLAITGATGASLTPWCDRWLQMLQNLVVAGRRPPDEAPGFGLRTGSIALTLPEAHRRADDLSVLQVSPPARAVVSGGSTTLDLYHHVVEPHGSWEFTDLKALLVRIGASVPSSLAFTHCAIDTLAVFAYPEVGDTVPLALRLRNCKLHRVILCQTRVSDLMLDHVATWNLKSLMLEKCVLDVVPDPLRQFVAENRQVYGFWPDPQPGRPVPITIEVKAKW